MRDEDKLQLVQNLTWKTGAHTAKFGFDVIRSRTRIDVDFNPSGNFTKITQRLPVRIAIEQREQKLRPGMMVEVRIDVRGR